jgi:hypothetical protein
MDRRNRALAYRQGWNASTLCLKQAEQEKLEITGNSRRIHEKLLIKFSPAEKKCKITTLKAANTHINYSAFTV